jgi:hypothetical protein
LYGSCSSPGSAVISMYLVTRRTLDDRIAIPVSGSMSEEPQGPSVLVSDINYSVLEIKRPEPEVSTPKRGHENPPKSST